MSSMYIKGDKKCDNYRDGLIPTIATIFERVIKSKLQ